MKNIKYLFLTALVSASSIATLAATAGDWKLHPSFDQYIEKVIDTPSKVYLQAYGQEHNVNYSTYSTPYPTIFVYDKGAEEILSYNKRNYLSDNIVVFVDYNADKKYLLISFDTGDIDLVYDNEEVVNIPALKNSTLPYEKTVNSVTFDGENNLAYLAMNFGYLVIDDKKGEVRESRVFDRKIHAVGRVGDFILMADDTYLLCAPASKRYPAISDFKQVQGVSNIEKILPLSGNKFLFIGSDKKLYKAELAADGTLSSFGQIYANSFNSIVGNRNGYLIAATNAAVQIDKDGNISSQSFDAQDNNSYCGSWDGKEYWFGKGRTGIYSRKVDNNSWTTTRQAILPNAPSAFQCEYIVPTNNHGMVTSNHGICKAFSDSGRQYPNLLCGYSGGTWRQYSPAWLNSALQSANTDPCGLAIDPDDERYVYSGSYYKGMIRLNMDDPSDVVQMTSPATQTNGVKFFEAFPNNAAWGAYAFAKVGNFDNYGNLWAYYAWNNGGGVGRLLCLPGNERRNGKFGNWKNFDLHETSKGPDNSMLALKNSSNQNFVVVFTGSNESEIIIFDHNGTLGDTSDDRIAYMTDIYDQDGTKVSKNCIHNFFEDEDGTVWALTDFGVFTFNPANAFSNPSTVNRIKVTRNDGTNLADYLLDGVNVWQVTVDGQGHKWFATAGAGLVCTSADGREILASYTTDNSFIPDNTVYTVAYNPETGSILMSTLKGIAEFFPPGSKTADKMDSIKIYPNPVRPDYYGYVTIEGLVDNTLVKIVDASGNLVKELGIAAGGAAQWDVSNAQLKRVHSGVYYVMASSSATDTNVNAIGKILVVN